MFKTISFGAVVAAGRYGCRDEEQWGTCITAYANKECIAGCDRTCGKCNTDICYDMIPHPHDKFWHDGLSVKSEWPTFSNDGGNTLPSKTDDIVDDLYPFLEGAVSQFCIDVFRQHLCDSQDLVLTYTDPAKGSSHDIVLTGFGYEYCRFSCGRCLQTAGCYQTHNSAMQFLARDPDADSGFNLGFDTDAWNFGGFDSTIDSFQEDEAEPEVSEGMQNDEGLQDPWSFDSFEEPEESSWNWDSFGWFRKKRDVDMPKEEILKAALKSIAFGLTYEHGPNPRFNHIVELVRKRRQTLNQMGDVTIERQQYFDSINVCWGANDSEESEPLEDVSVEEEEEDGDNELDQIIERRSEEDNAGIEAYFSAKADTDNMELLGCEYDPIAIADDSYLGMTLYYRCYLQCSGNSTPAAYNANEDATKEIDPDHFNVECYRPNNILNKIKPVSPCDAMNAPGWSLICVESEEEQVEATEPPQTPSIVDEAEQAYADYMASFQAMYYGY